MDIYVGGDAYANNDHIQYTKRGNKNFSDNLKESLNDRLKKRLLIFYSNSQLDPTQTEDETLIKIITTVQTKRNRTFNT